MSEHNQAIRERDEALTLLEPLATVYEAAADIFKRRDHEQVFLWSGGDIDGQPGRCLTLANAKAAHDFLHRIREGQS